jgi:hypothetical protein
VLNIKDFQAIYIMEYLFCSIRADTMFLFVDFFFFVIPFKFHGTTSHMLNFSRLKITCQLEAVTATAATAVTTAASTAEAATAAAVTAATTAMTAGV